MATRKPKPVEVHPISINPNTEHKPEDEQNDQLDLDQEPVEQTLEEARAEEASDDQEYVNGRGVGNPSPSPTRVRLNTPSIRAAITHAALDYLSTAGVMPSILDLFEIVREDEALAHLTGLTDSEGAPLLTHAKLASQVNRIRKDQEAAIAAKQAKGEDTTDMVVLPPLARTQRTVTPRVSDAEALARLVAERLVRLPKVEPTNESATA